MLTITYYLYIGVNEFDLTPGMLKNVYDKYGVDTTQASHLVNIHTTHIHPTHIHTTHIHTTHIHPTHIHTTHIHTTHIHLTDHVT